MSWPRNVIVELGRECESAITGLPAELEDEDSAVKAIRAELALGRKAYQELRTLENALAALSKPRKIL